MGVWLRLGETGSGERQYLKLLGGKNPKAAHLSQIINEAVVFQRISCNFPRQTS